MIISSAGENAEELEFSYAGENDKMYSYFENSLAVSYNIKHIPYDSAILLLGIYPREMKAYIYTKSNTWIFIAALFITA